MQNGSHKLYQPRVWNKEEQQLLDAFKNEKGFDVNIKMKTGLHKSFISGPGTHEPNSKFDYEYWINKQEKKLKGLIHFGTHVEGPPNMVHGGAIAAMIDSVTGVLAWKCGFTSVTVNLNVNYKKFIPLDTTVQVEAVVEKVDGRKIFVKAILKNLKGDIIHNDGTALYLKVDPEIIKNKQ